MEKKDRRNSFCKGIICSKYNRTHKCCMCGVWLCGACAMISTFKGGIKKVYCPNCYVSPNWDKLNTEFDEMISTLFPKKEPVEVVKDDNAINPG